MINVAVLGYGTVGSGVVEVIEKNKDMVNKKSAQELEVKYILDLRDFPGDPYEDKVIHDFNTILHDDSVTIVCETMGGVGAAYQFTKQALERGKSVCTSNKELVAKHGPELLQIAREHNCNYLFEASVGGGIPIIRPLNYSLTAEKIEAINGILNGTTNYILSKMEKEGADFAAVLKEAQDKGYAERNPEADVEGYDACRKIAILTSLVAGKTVDFHKIHTEGITGIDPTDFAYAKKLDATIKLLAVSRETEDGYQISVAPYLLKKENALAGVNDVFNAVAVCGNTLGDTMFYGRGAGKLPTASAVVADVVECARHLQKTVGCLWEEGEAKVADFDSQEGRFFVRVLKKARADVEKVFGAVVPVVLDSALEEFAFVTESMQEAEFEKCREQIFGFVKKIRIKD